MLALINRMAMLRVRPKAKVPQTSTHLRKQKQGSKQSTVAVLC